MKYWRGSTVLIIVAVLLVFVFLSLTSAPAAQATTSVSAPVELADDLSLPAASTSLEKPLVSEPVSPTLSKAVRDLPLVSHDRSVTPAGRRPPISMTPAAQGNIVADEDPLLASSRLGQGETPTPTLTFEGLGNTCACSPPDTIGDVGPNHYVQLVNATTLKIFDKAGNTLAGPVALNSLWSSGNCSTSNNGDPVVVYDSLANRWVLAQFSTGNGVCVAVSQTADPTGAYYGYEFSTPSFPDYFKISVWPDAYYMSANETTYAAYALDRAKMLAGQAASFVRFAGQTNFLMPADVDGPTPPPAGAPGYFYTFKDDTFHGGADRLEVFELKVNWTTPANSTFVLTQSIPISSYTYTVCGFFVLTCIPQGGTSQKVDPVSEWPMWRLVYRNFGTHQTLLGNFTIDVGSDRAGIRWFELRKAGGNWSLYQQGTHAPADNQHRWMGSIAMDGTGNVALGYSVSNSSTFPSIQYATRLATDSLGTLQTEQLMYAGGGSQTGSSRWGDYSAMSIDPADDCTFWFTTEYYPINASNNWHTRIGKFKIPSCGAPVFSAAVTKTVDQLLPLPGQRITYTIAAVNTGDTITNVVVSDTLPAGLLFAGPVTLQGVAGTVATSTQSLPNLAAITTFSTGLRFTVTLPVTVNVGLISGTRLTNTAELIGGGLSGVISSVGFDVANAPPTAADQLVTTTQGISITINPLLNSSDLNGDALSIFAIGSPLTGTASISGATIVYTPPLTFAGTDVFSYTLTDGHGGLGSATVTVNVQPDVHLIYLPIVLKTFGP